MKRRGFTLIELLAVIVVLAIIALIATPVVMNTIKSAQKGAAERSAERYLEAVETAIVKNKLNNETIADGSYQIVDGQLQGTTLDIEIKGDYPKSGTIKIEKGQVVSNGTSIMIGEYTITIDTNGKANATEQGEVKDLASLGLGNLWYDGGQGAVYVVDVSKLPDGMTIEDELFAFSSFDLYFEPITPKMTNQEFIDAYGSYLISVGNYFYESYPEATQFTINSGEVSHVWIYKTSGSNRIKVGQYYIELSVG